MNGTEAIARRPADVWAQLESLFDTVWKCERQWRIDDRFDLILGLQRVVR